MGTQVKLMDFGKMVLLLNLSIVSYVCSTFPCNFLERTVINLINCAIIWDCYLFVALSYSFSSYPTKAERKDLILLIYET